VPVQPDTKPSNIAGGTFNNNKFDSGVDINYFKKINSALENGTWNSVDKIFTKEYYKDTDKLRLIEYVNSEKEKILIMKENVINNTIQLNKYPFDIRVSVNQEFVCYSIQYYQILTSFRFLFFADGGCFGCGGFRKAVRADAPPGFTQGDDILRMNRTIGQGTGVDQQIGRCRSGNPLRRLGQQIGHLRIDHAPDGFIHAAPGGHVRELGRGLGSMTGE
jgi:hypothetical protein